MSDDACTSCGAPAHEPATRDDRPTYGSVVRAVGRDSRGNVTKLCPKCFSEQNAPKQPVANQLPLNKKRTKR